MKIASINIPKKKNSEDVILLEHNVVGIFDGSTSLNNNKINDESYGAFAAKTASQAVIECINSNYFNSNYCPEKLLVYITKEMSIRCLNLKLKAPYPTTTCALSIFGKNQIHFLIVGDTKIRINKNSIHTNPIKIDDIWTSLRKLIFEYYCPTNNYPECLSDTSVYDEFVKCEEISRAVIYNGLHSAEKKLSDYVLSGFDMSETNILHDANYKDLIKNLVMKGIAKGQYLFANSVDEYLGYAILNGKKIQGEYKAFSLPVELVKTIEIFSDGYISPPLASDDFDAALPSIDCWEDLYNKIEMCDPFHLTTWPHLKASVNNEFFDDRSLVLVELDKL